MYEEPVKSLPPVNVFPRLEVDPREGPTLLLTDKARSAVSQGCGLVLAVTIVDATYCGLHYNPANNTTLSHLCQSCSHRSVLIQRGSFLITLAKRDGPMS